MGIEVRGQKGQDGGNKRNKGDAEVHEEAVKLLIGTRAVNLLF